MITLCSLVLEVAGSLQGQEFRVISEQSLASPSLRAVLYWGRLSLSTLYFKAVFSDFSFKRGPFLPCNLVTVLGLREGTGTLRWNASVFFWGLVDDSLKGHKVSCSVAPKTLITRCSDRTGDLLVVRRPSIAIPCRVVFFFSCWQVLNLHTFCSVFPILSLLCDFAVFSFAGIQTVIWTFSVCSVLPPLYLFQSIYLSSSIISAVSLSLTFL